MPEQQQPEKKESKGTTKLIIILSINIVILLVIFIVTASIKKEKFLTSMFIYMGVFFGMEILFFVGLVFYRKYIKGKGQKAGMPKYSLDEVEVLAEEYMWKRESVKRKDCLTFLSEPRAVQLSSGADIEVYVWLFKEMVSIFRREYLFVSLVSDPSIKGYRRISIMPTEDDITKFARQIAKQPLEPKITRFTRTDPTTGNVVTEEIYEPIYPTREGKPEASKL